MNPNDRNANQQQQQQSKSDSGKNAVLPSDNSGKQGQGNSPKHGADTNPGQSDFGGKDKDKQPNVNAPGTNKDGQGMKSAPNQQGNDSNGR